MTKDIECNCGLRDHIQKMIDKCKQKKLEIQNAGFESLPIEGLDEERYEYLDGLEGKLQFMLDYPEREQVV